tara:strand:- start:396 stop:596 length:201 start_codon:yes stop_codon:yes gene_type:complete
MIEQDSTSYSKEDQSKFVDAWETNIERIEKNRKIMKEGRDAVATFRLLGLLKDKNCGELRKWDKIP